jgi:ATP-dependent DNA ligase
MKKSVPLKSQPIPIKPMLAYNFEKYQHSIQYPLYVQPKLDGNRCIAYCDVGTSGASKTSGDVENVEITFYSRSGKIIEYLNHIRKYLESWIIQKKFKDSFYLDGELFIENSNTPRAELIYKLRSFLGKKFLSPQNELEQQIIHFHLFDAFFPSSPSKPFKERWKWIESNFKKKPKDCPIDLVPTSIVQSENELYELRDHYLELGGEGIIVRKMDGMYRVGYKSTNVLRSKKVFSNSFIIDGFTEGKGKNSGTVIWILKCKKTGRTFQARPMGTHENRTKWFKDAKKWIGKKVTVKYFDIDKNGCVRRNPVAVME